VASGEDSHKGKVAAALNLAIFITTAELQVVQASLVEGLLARPFESLRPSLVTEPVADEIGITSID